MKPNMDLCKRCQYYVGPFKPSRMQSVTTWILDSLIADITLGWFDATHAFTCRNTHYEHNGFCTCWIVEKDYYSNHFDFKFTVPERCPYQLEHLLTTEDEE